MSHLSSINPSNTFTTPSRATTKASTLHPLAALTPDELTTISRVVKSYNASKTCLFRRCLLVEPPKALVVPYLQAELSGAPLPPVPTRRGQALFYFEGEQDFMEALVDITRGTLLGQRILPGEHGPGDDDEVLEIGAKALASPIVQAELERLQLPQGCEVIPEPWPYGSDDTPTPTRLSQVWFFLNYAERKDHPSSNFYAHPLDFSCVVDIATMEVVRIDRMPTDGGIEVSTDPNARFRPNPDCEYAPELLAEGVRKDLKPLHISQPEGVSFTIADDGETVKWQKWEFRVCFDVREGMILRNVKYDGRPIFYRLALSEMTVPYGDPRAPVHRKSAFDLGECGAGQTANNLQLGCDCLGVIHYFDGMGTSADGRPVKIPHAICIHEQDAGLGWKHTNIRTGRADVTRARELVFQLIVTVGNYEYALYFVFDTAATLHYEIRATGIMSVTPADPSADFSETAFGTVVADGVFAPHHQHLFNLRIDPAIDGYDGSVVTYDDVYPMKRDERNPHGVGFEVKSTKVENESAFNLDWTTNRVVKMVNPNKRNKFSGKPVGFKIMAPPTQLGLADPTSMHNIRGEFVNNHVHVTKYADNELWGSGEHLWQSRGGRGGCRTWAERGRKLENDSVVWFTLGFTHATRSEDWPVMPSEHFRMSFKPVGFFEQNPALDVPPSKQHVNQSRYAFPDQEAPIKPCCHL
ncbi:primary amine oxidase [Leucosporidium creatinivorum]|uniref:Amine oxidase n=1 Tax=Leucosporidium creatinivorum TaxID=106004 RepID=A0A1Y2FBJ5_9BASI|nr:primary amine oxidase [Leucosporidium creatinivorum]